MRGVSHPPVFCKNLFLQVGDPKGVHQGYHEMTYTKLGAVAVFAKMRGVGGPGGVKFVFSEKALCTVVEFMSI